MTRTTIPTLSGLCVLASSLILLSLPREAHAQCAFDAPAKARSIKSSLVRANSPCPLTSTVPYPNTNTTAGVAACTPPTPRSLYTFDDTKGWCSVLVKHSVETPCPDEIASSCSVVKITTKCAGVLDPFVIPPTPTSTAGWTLNIINRATFDDESNGDMTIIDFPLTLEMPPFENGKLKSNVLIGGPCDGLLCDPFGPSIAPPPCTQMEILSIALRDPDGNVFATLGSSGR
jgi:hypothetical protein